ncbi:MAG: hypothetical protein HYZ93_02410 [Candidatus Omnitrophica bacterium]|nr:hypothetical protein [Candidatus Omnitrophota bacterium]
MIRKLLAKLVGGSPRPKRRTGKKRSAPKKKKPAAKKRPSKKPEKEMGRVVAFFRIPVVAVIRVKQGTLKPGERIWIKGHTTDLKQTVTSIQINHQPVRAVRKGQEAGVKVSARARRGDRVYRLK